MNRAGVAALAAVLAAASLGASTADATQSAVVRGLELRRDEVVVIALHPTAVPIEIESSNGRLEACQGTLDGKAGTSWPSFAGFDECIPFEDGHATLPSVRVDTFHLAFMVRTTNHTRVTVDRLEVTYEPGDGFFALFPPPIAAGDSSPRVQVTPRVSSVVHSSVGDPETFGRIDGLRLVITQHGERVRQSENSEPTSMAGPAYGPLELGAPVNVRVLNTSRSPAVIGLYLDWD